MGWELTTSLNQQLTQPQSQQRELTVREIWNRILRGETVRIPNDPIAAGQLKNHLNVIKSREKQIMLNLGFDFISSVVCISEIYLPPNLSEETRNKILNAAPGTLIPVKDGEFGTPYLAAFEVKLQAPKKKRTYTTFSVKNNEPIPT